MNARPCVPTPSSVLIFAALLLLFLSLAGITLIPESALAAAAGPSGASGVSGGGYGGTGTSISTPPNNLPGYLSRVYFWFLGFVGISALFAIVTGGIMYMFAGANITKADQAKKWITNAVYGIILAAASYLILNTINPDFVTHGFDLQRILNNLIYDAGDKGASIPAPARPSNACSGCTRLAAANVPVKPGACGASSLFECQVSQDLAGKLSSLNRGILKDKTGGYWRVTEAWPPTRQHQNSCHAEGTCVDANLGGSATKNPPDIAYFISKAEQAGLRPVYEVESENRARELVRSGIDRRHLAVLPPISGNRQINEEHFSLYQR